MPKNTKSADTQEVYVAFSIHRTNCFITANKIVPASDASGSSFTIDGFSFSKGRSRETPLRGAIKLLWPELEHKGQPLTDPQKIWDAFQRLKGAGWTVEDDSFIQKHKINVKKSAPPLEAVSARTPSADPKTSQTPKKTIEKPAVDPLAAAMANPSGLVPAKQGGSLSLPSNDAAFAELDKPLPAIKIGDDGIVRGTMDYAGTETGRFDKAAVFASNYGTPPAEATAKEPADDNASNEAERAIVERTMKKDLSRRLYCVQGDITALDVDVVINAANSDLIPGGGVDGAINKAAGSKLGEAMRALGGCATGSAKITDGFDLNAYQIVHAVGPVYRNYSDLEAERLLRSAYAMAFDLAAQADAHSIAAPLLSTGVYGYPMNSACYIAVDEAYKFLRRSPDVATTVTLVAFDQKAFETLLEQSKRVYNDLALTPSDDLPKVTSPHN